MALYKADLDAIVDMLFSLREGQPTLIVAQNFYVPIYDYEKELGIFEECLPWWEAQNEAIAEMAAERGLLLADVFTAFNGTDHLEDPRDKGYISDDGEHTNEAGRMAIADVFRALGYEMIVP